MPICAYVVRRQAQSEGDEENFATSNGFALDRAAEDPRTPIRGLMLALVLSGILWTGLLLAARELWILWR
jgi:hypothetical protein